MGWLRRKAFPAKQKQSHRIWSAVHLNVKRATFLEHFQHPLSFFRCIVVITGWSWKGWCQVFLKCTGHISCLCGMFRSHIFWLGSAIWHCILQQTRCFREFIAARLQQAAYKCNNDSCFAGAFAFTISHTLSCLYVDCSIGSSSNSMHLNWAD